MNLLRAAEAADSDGFLVTFLQDKIKLDDMKEIVAILAEFRTWRDSQRDEDDQREPVEVEIRWPNHPGN